MIDRTALDVIKREKKLLFTLVGTSLGHALSIVGQAWFFATLLDHFIFSDYTWREEGHTLVLLLVAILCRLLFSYYQEKASLQLGGVAKEMLRRHVLEHIFAVGIRSSEAQGDIIHLITDGLEQVDAYVARYVPQMMYAIIIPVVLGIAITDTMPIIGIVLLVTLPLIPLFMILIGRQAEKMNTEQWERMSFLSGHFLDVLRGITTLKVFRRAQEQIQVIDRLSREFKDSTLKVLRVAFMSALVLELVSTISTAIIAVYLGLTLLDGGTSFFAAFFILLLAPEFYAPFRQLGAAFHTGMAGKTSIEKYRAFMKTPVQLPTGGDICIDEPIESIEVRDLSYTYEGTENGVRHINMSVRRNRPVMLVGESGAGKSTVGHIIAGFLEAPPETVLINGHDIGSLDMAWWHNEIIYVSQHPHIMNGTLREIIAFGQNVTDEEIISACKDAELWDVISGKEGGLDFVVGESGLGLSGGEKQRIALARAFLRPGSVLILDEVTAHMDVKTEASISRALRRLMKDKLVICIGHRLQTMVWAETLYVLRNGEIVQIGSYESLAAEPGYFKELVEAGTGAFRACLEEAAFPVSETNISVIHEESENILSGTDAVVSSGGACGPKKRESTKKTPSPWAAWKLLLSVLSPAKWSLPLALLFTFLTVFTNVGLLSVSSWLLATAALQPGLTYLSLAIVGVRFFGISRAVCRYIERYTSHKMAFQGLYGLRVWFYTHLEPLAPSIFKRLGAGDVLGRIMADIEVLQFFYLRTLIPPVSAVLLTALVAYGVGTVDGRLTYLVVGAAIVTGVLLPYTVYRYHRDSLHRISRMQGLLKTRLGDMLEGMEDIISYHNQELVLKSLQTVMDTVGNHNRRISMGMNTGNTVFMGIVQLVVIGAAVLAADALVGSRASVMVAVAAISVQAWFECMQPMISVCHHGYESYVAVQRLLELNDEEPPVIDTGLKTTGRVERIVFDHVSFSYDADTVVYDDLSLTVPEGQSVAIVGASGSGKSTLFNILERLYDYSGHIRINDEELRELRIDPWREKVGIITQDTYVFHASLEDNIRIAAPKATKAEIEDAVERAALTGVVWRLPQGLKTVIGSGGVGLSGGERQRLALARLFLVNPEIVLLDEPLEGLDQVTRKRLHTDLMAFCSDKTVLYITHQLDGLESMDRIIFMENGVIEEDGTFEELLVKNGKFSEYCRLSMARI